MDIIIFESSLETDQNDKVIYYIMKYDYLRLLCTIPITLLKLNQKKILAAKSVKELDTHFSDLSKSSKNNVVVKSYNVEKFIQHIRTNIDDFYKMQSIMDRYLNFRTTSTSWDHKRDKITKKVQKHFSQVEEDSKMFLEKIDPVNI